jgi:hypothetical protein
LITRLISSAVGRVLFTRVEPCPWTVLATAADLVGAELGHEFVGLTPLKLEDLFDDGAIDDKEARPLIWATMLGGQ